MRVIKSTFDEFHAEDPADARFFIKGHVGRNGLVFRIRTRDLRTNRTSTIAARTFFDAMMKALEPGDPPFYAVIGEWSDREPDYVTNLYHFNTAVASGVAAEVAAAGTPTGKMAAAWGYTEVRIVHRVPSPPAPVSTFVLVRFIHPGK